MRILNLDTLFEEIPGVSPTRRAFYREAAIVGLKRQGHSSGAQLKIAGDFEETVQLIWEQDVEDVIINSWRDEVQIAHFGAVGISLLLAKEFLGYQSFEEGVIGTGIDFWMGKGVFQKDYVSFIEREARLEVSGIFSEHEGNTVNMRVSRKKKQMKVSDHVNLVGWIVVVEFSAPKSKIVKK